VEELDLENEEDARRVSETDVVARVEPKQKMALVEAVQSLGKAAGMTGDGINDAPALKRANIGIAMGERGTEAAKQVADIVLRDDSLATIVEAVRRGRTIMDNIRKAAMFMLCTNLAEIIAVTIGVALDYPLPLLALQILYLNVVTDVFPALALGVGPPVQGLMNQRTLESSRSILTASHWSAIVALGVVLATTTLVSLVMAIEVLGLSATAATTVSFMTLGFSKVWFPFNLRHVESPFLLNEITRNAWLWLALLLCVMLLLIAVYGSPLAGVLDTAELPLNAWGLVLALSLVPLVLSQVFLLIMKLRAAS